MATHELVVPRSMPMTLSTIAHLYTTPDPVAAPMSAQGFEVRGSALFVTEQLEGALDGLEDRRQLLVVLAERHRVVAVGVELLRQAEVGALDFLAVGVARHSG